MSNVQRNFNAGQTKGQTQARVEEWTASFKDTTNAARDSVSSGDQSQWDSAQQVKEERAGFLQQTGEQVKNMAQGAVDTMKNTAQGAVDTVKNTFGTADKTK